MTVQPTTPMPTDGTYGKVVGRFVLAVADADDPDRLPDAVAPKGTVTFTPAVPVAKFDLPQPTTVVRVPIVCTLDDDGNVVDPQGNIGVWLMAGVYKVNYNFAGITVLTSGPIIEVLTTNDDDHPLDLTSVMTPPGTTLSPSQYAILAARLDAIDYPVDSVNGMFGRVVLDATDVGAYTKAETDGKFATQQELNDARFTQVEADLSAIDYPVDSVNGKTGSVQLAAGDVGAYSKAEADARFAAENEMAWKSVVDPASDVRPDALHVIWVGGFVKPSNMTTEDLWVQETA